MLVDANLKHFNKFSVTCHLLSAVREGSDKQSKQGAVLRLELWVITFCLRPLH